MGVILGSPAEVESTFVCSAWIVIDRNLTMRKGLPFNPTRSPRKKGEWKSLKKIMTATVNKTGNRIRIINAENKKSNVRIMGQTHCRFSQASPHKTALYGRGQVDHLEVRQVQSKHFDQAKFGQASLPFFQK
jgi:hypothetical protein